MNRHVFWSFLAIAFAVVGVCYTGYEVTWLAWQAPYLVTFVVLLLSPPDQPGSNSTS